MTDPLQDRLRAGLADRYNVLHEIGRGGMATVYLAEERHPKRRVAIKVFDPNLAPHLLRERFLREIDLVSKLAHPHIVPVFAAGEVDGLLYYIMPYIDGESLRHRLRREGSLSPDEAAQIGREVASALQYAHEQGIIHRDIKPENILLAGGHAMVADFGIARAVGAAGGQHLTQTGFAMGTPAYMSPEQWAGSGEIDGRTDVFSLGCVVFEMLEGQLPPDGLARRRESIRQLFRRSHSGRHTPSALRGAVQRALAPRPVDRYPTAGDFGKALGGSGGFSGAFGTRVTNKKLAAAAAILLLLTAALGIGILLPTSRSGSLPSRVVVSLFENRTGDPSLTPLGMMAADWVTQGLAQTGLVEVVGTRTAMAAVLRNGRPEPAVPAPPPQRAGPEGTLPPRAPMRPGPVPDAGELGLALAKETGAEIVVWGAYYMGDARTVQFQAQITSATDGRLLRALEPVASPVDSPLAAVETLRQRVMGALATIFDERLSSWATVASQPPSYDAYQEYIEGMTLFMQLEQVEGIRHLYRAAQYDSTFVTPLLFAAFAHATLGDWTATDSISQIVNRFRDQLSPFDRHLLDWTLAMTQGDYEGALAAVRRAADISPGAEPQSLVGLTALMANRPAETLEAFQQLDPERGLMEGFFLYWHYIGAAHHLLGNHRRELASLRRGLRQYPSNPMLGHMELSALAAMGAVEELADSLDSREQRPSTWAHEPAVTSWGDLLRLISLELRAHGYQEDAGALSQRAARWYAARPEDSLRSEAFRYGLARTLYQIEALTRARKIFEELVALRSDSVAYRGYLGSIAARQGDDGRAQEIAHSLEELDRPYLFGYIPYWRARIAARLGDGDSAVRLMRKAFAEGYPYHNQFHADADLQLLQDDPAYRALLAPKQ